MSDLFAIRWNEFYDCLSILFHDDGIWIYIDRTNRFNARSIVIPLGFWEMETLGL